MTDSKIQKFYKGTNIFITGGTGFLGKILIEKLLRSTDVDLIYLLVRDKKGKNIHTRTDELIDDIIFEKLKKECPKFRHKLEPISGDCAISGMGLKLEDRQKLIENVNVVFHVAATVRFDENLKLAYSVNVNAIKEVMHLSRQMKKLKSLVHVSTAYSNCIYPEVEEKLYDYNLNYDEVGMLLEKLSHKEADDLTPRVLGKWPNTYTFTKALAENLIKRTGNGLPIAVFRPSIVVSTNSEPIPGWLDNMYGPTSVCVGVGSGLLRVITINPDATADLIPVDTCVAGLIAAAWDVAEKSCVRTTENIPVYNYISSVENPISWGEFFVLNSFHYNRYPISNQFWYPVCINVPNLKWFNLFIIVFHTLPAMILDFFLFLSGSKPRLMNMSRKVNKMIAVTSYFSTRTWNFHNDNVVKLYEKMDHKDQEIFPMSMKKVDWFRFFKKYMYHVRKYALNDPDHTLKDARKKFNRLYWIHSILVNLIKVIFVIFIWSMFAKILWRN